MTVLIVVNKILQNRCVVNINEFFCQMIITFLFGLGAGFVIKLNTPPRFGRKILKGIVTFLIEVEY